MKYNVAMPKKQKRPQQSPPKCAVEPGRETNLNEVFALLGVIILGLAVFGRCATYDYVLYDDPNIIFNNPHVMSGLSLKNIYWALTNPNFGLYQPLPTISFMIDRELFGDWAGGFHLMTLLWHLLCACALFMTLKRLLNNFPVALAVALLFTAHPVQAMTVNWIAARNEIMPAFFMLLSIEAYRRYATKRGYGAYGASLVFMLLAVMSKQGAIMLPALLLLLDYWPLRRIEINFFKIGGAARAALPLLLEKTPWFALTGLGVFFAFFGKTQFNVLDRNTLMSPLDNMGFALTAYVRYLFHLLYPFRYVTAYSPSTDWITPPVVLGAALVLTAISGVALLLHARRPYLIVGWGWFVLSLLPVCGLVRFASESIALRYLYAPAIGLYLMVAFLIYEIYCPNAAQSGKNDAVAAGAPDGYKKIIGSLVFILAVLCFWQSGFWRDSETLAWRALAATNDTNAIAHNHLGHIRVHQGRHQEAEKHMRAAMELEPQISIYTFNYAVLLLLLGRHQESLDLLAPIVAKQPDNAQVISQYGAALAGLQRFEEARKYLERTLEIEPDNASALYNLATVLIQQEKRQAAKKHLQTLLKLRPSNRQAKALLDSIE